MALLLRKTDVGQIQLPLFMIEMLFSICVVLQELMYVIGLSCLMYSKLFGTVVSTLSGVQCILMKSEVACVGKESFQIQLRGLFVVFSSLVPGLNLPTDEKNVDNVAQQINTSGRQEDVPPRRKGHVVLRV